jgi:CRP/FNR family cyclic AMP-dependent transcriptional regulator
MNAEPAQSATAAPCKAELDPVASALRTCPWFNGLPEGTLAELAAAASLRSFSARQPVVREGRWQGAALLVVRGSLRSVRRPDHAREVTLETFRPGDLIADAVVCPEVSLPGEGLVAVETSLLLFVTREAFLAALAAVPQAALALVRDLGRRLDQVKLLATGLLTANVESRLHRLLVNLARAEGQPAGEDIVISRLPTQHDLASRIGASRETVSRIVADLDRQQIVSREGRKLTLGPRFFESAKAAGIV